MNGYSSVCLFVVLQQKTTPIDNREVKVKLKMWRNKFLWKKVRGNHKTNHITISKKIKRWRWMWKATDKQNFFLSFILCQSVLSSVCITYVLLRPHFGSVRWEGGAREASGVPLVSCPCNSCSLTDHCWGRIAAFTDEKAAKTTEQMKWIKIQFLTLILFPKLTNVSALIKRYGDQNHKSL